MNSKRKSTRNEAFLDSPRKFESGVEQNGDRRIISVPSSVPLFVRLKAVFRERRCSFLGWEVVSVSVT
jgi:hypothetical protein